MVRVEAPAESVAAAALAVARVTAVPLPHGELDVDTPEDWARAVELAARVAAGNGLVAADKAPKKETDLTYIPTIKWLPKPVANADARMTTKNRNGWRHL